MPLLHTKLWWEIFRISRSATLHSTIRRERGCCFIRYPTPSYVMYQQQLGKILQSFGLSFLNWKLTNRDQFLSKDAKYTDCKKDCEPYTDWEQWINNNNNSLRLLHNWPLQLVFLVWTIIGTIKTQDTNTV